jgi:hypothetical protein
VFEKTNMPIPLQKLAGRTSFLDLLATRDVLSTRTKLLYWGFKGNVECVFLSIWEIIYFSHVVLVAEWRGKTMKAYYCRLVFGSTIYNIWKNKNALRHGNKNSTITHYTHIGRTTKKK